MNSVPTQVVGVRPPSAPPPKVSVAMITYRHERFIAQAVESVMMQRTSFPCELIISDDCSPDRTREIVLNLQRKYPDRIRVLLPEKNLGMMTNSFLTLLACDGQYVARLEGDDYWLDPDKLQRQVELLDAHPEFSACFTRAKVFSGDDPAPLFYIPADNPHKAAYTTEDLLAKNYIATGSIMYRNFFRDIDLEPLLPLGLDDWPVHVLFSLRGPIGYINDVMSAYRLHEGGVWTRMEEIPKLEVHVQVLRVLRGILPVHYTSQIIGKIAKIYQLIALELLRKGNKRSSRSYTLKSLASIPLTDIFRFKWYLKRSVVLLFGTFSLPLERVERLLHE